MGVEGGVRVRGSKWTAQISGASKGMLTRGLRVHLSLRLLRMSVAVENWSLGGDARSAGKTGGRWSKEPGFPNHAHSLYLNFYTKSFRCKSFFSITPLFLSVVSVMKLSIFVRKVSYRRIHVF